MDKRSSPQVNFEVVMHGFVFYFSSVRSLAPSVVKITFLAEDVTASEAEVSPRFRHVLVLVLSEIQPFIFVACKRYT